MFPLTPALSPKRRGGRPCQYQEGADRANFCVEILQPTGRSHVPPHPSPLPKEERGPTVPISGEGAEHANFCVEILQPTGRSHVPPHPSPLPKEERGPTVPISRGSRPCQFLCGDPSAPREVACSPSPQPSPQRERVPTVPISGEGVDRANFCVEILQPTGRSHVPPHPNPLPNEEREPTVPVSGEGADRTNIRRGGQPCHCFLWGSFRP